MNNMLGAGEIIEVGEGASKFKVGDRVTATFCQWPTGPFSQQIFATAMGGPVDGVGRKCIFNNLRPS